MPTVNTRTPDSRTPGGPPQRRTHNRSIPSLEFFTPVAPTVAFYTPFSPHAHCDTLRDEATTGSDTVSQHGEPASTPCSRRGVSQPGACRNDWPLVLISQSRPSSPWHCVWRVSRQNPARTVVNLLAPQRQWIALGKAGPLTTLPLIALSTEPVGGETNFRPFGKQSL